MNRTPAVLHRALNSNWFLFLCGAALLGNAVYGIATGSVTMAYRTIRRSEDPRRFWLAVVVCGGFGVASMWAGIF